MSILRTAARAGPEFDVLVAADEHAEAGDFASALALLDAGALRGCGSSRAAVLRGWCLENLGRLDEAEASYAAALSVAPGDLDALEGLANVLWSLARTGEAVIRWQTVVDFVEGRPDPIARELELCGWSLFRLTRLDEAEACLRRALELDPASLSVRFDLALVLLANGSVEQASGEYALAVESAHRLGMEVVRGVVCVALDDFTSARDALPQSVCEDELERIHELLAAAASSAAGPGRA